MAAEIKEGWQGGILLDSCCRYGCLWRMNFTDFFRIVRLLCRESG